MTERAELELCCYALRPLLVGRAIRGSGVLHRHLDLCLWFREAPLRDFPCLRLACGPPHRARIALDPGRFGKDMQLHGGLSRALEAFHGAVLTGLRCLPGERILELSFRKEEGGGRLLAECFGPRGNWFLCDTEGRILAYAHRPGGKRADLQPGARYRPPGGGSTDAAVGGSPPAIPDPPSAESAPRLPPDVLELALQRARTWAERELEAELLETRNALERVLEKERRGLGRRIEGLESRREREEGWEEWKRRGDLLLTCPRLQERGRTEIEVRDWYEEGLPRRIPLDPRLDLRENAERCFDRARRLREGAAHTLRGLEEARTRAREVETRLAEVREAFDRGDLGTLRSLARSLPLPGKKSGTGRGGEPSRKDRVLRHCRRFRTRDGLEVLVGKSNTDNDVLTLRLAKGNDLWLHVGGGHAGSHVVLRIPKGRSLPQESLLDAATLALHFSRIRGATTCEILYTKIKEVHKPKGAPPGKVELRTHKTLKLRFEEDRLRRLLARNGEKT